MSRKYLSRRITSFTKGTSLISGQIENITSPHIYPTQGSHISTSILCLLGAGLSPWPEIEAWIITISWRWSQGLYSYIHAVTQKHRPPDLDFPLICQAWRKECPETGSGKHILEKGWLLGTGPCSMLAATLRVSFILEQQLGTNGDTVYMISVKINMKALLTLEGLHAYTKSIWKFYFHTATNSLFLLPLKGFSS